MGFTDLSQLKTLYISNGDTEVLKIVENTKGLTRISF